MSRDSTDFGMQNLGEWLMAQLRRDVAALRGDGMVAAGQAIAKDAERTLVTTDTVYTGRLAEAFGVERLPDGVLLVNAMPYAAEVEFGRPPGPVDGAAILEWTRVKLFGLPRRVVVAPIRWGRATPLPGFRRRAAGVRKVTRSRQERASRRRNAAVNTEQLEAEAAAAAKRITENLREHGTAPVPFFKPAHAQGAKAIGRFVRRYLPTRTAAVAALPF